MPYRTPGNPRAGISQTGNVSTKGLNRFPEYSTRSNFARNKHNLDSIAVHTATDDIPSGQYAWLQLLKFKRTFTGVADTPDTPVAGTNNFNTTQVFNGSRIERFNATIQLSNKDTTLRYVDVYMCALSFDDVLVWNAVNPGNCPLTQNITPGSISGGEISNKAIAANLVEESAIKNYSFVNRYIKKVGTLSLPVTADGAPSAQIVLTDAMVPPKVRRANSGMYWCLFFSNPATKNDNALISVYITGEITFDEIPSSNRQVNYPG